jgi:hypothetical protein
VRAGRGIFPERLGRDPQGGARIDRAGDDQHRVVGLVIGAIESLQALDRHVLDVGACTDRRLAVVVPEESSLEHPLLQHFSRVVLILLEFVAHDRHLGVEIGPRHVAVHHAIGFHVERPSEVLGSGRESLEIVGAIEGRRAVGPATVLGQLLMDLWMARGALEEQVLEQVRHPRFAVVLVAGAHQVGDVDGDRLLGLVRAEEDAEPVRQPVLLDALDGGDRRHARRQAALDQVRLAGGRRADGPWPAEEDREGEG